MGSRIPDRSINGGSGTRTHTLEALVPKTNAAAITPHPQVIGYPMAKPIGNAGNCGNLV